MNADLTPNARLVLKALQEIANEKGKNPFCVTRKTIGAKADIERLQTISEALGKLEAARLIKREVKTKLKPNGSRVSYLKIRLKSGGTESVRTPSGFRCSYPSDRTGTAPIGAPLPVNTGTAKSVPAYPNEVPATQTEETEQQILERRAELRARWEELIGLQKSFTELALEYDRNRLPWLIATGKPRDFRNPACAATLIDWLVKAGVEPPLDFKFQKTLEDNLWALREAKSRVEQEREREYRRREQQRARERAAKHRAAIGEFFRLYKADVAPLRECKDRNAVKLLLDVAAELVKIPEALRPQRVEFDAARQEISILRLFPNESGVVVFNAQLRGIAFRSRTDGREERILSEWQRTELEHCTSAYLNQRKIIIKETAPMLELMPVGSTNEEVISAIAPPAELIPLSGAVPSLTASPESLLMAAPVPATSTGGQP